MLVWSLWVISTQIFIDLECFCVFSPPSLNAPVLVCIHDWRRTANKRQSLDRRLTADTWGLLMNLSGVSGEKLSVWDLTAVWKRRNIFDFLFQIETRRLTMWSKRTWICKEENHLNQSLLGCTGCRNVSFNCFASAHRFFSCSLLF